MKTLTPATTQPVEVIDAKQSAAILKRCEQKITEAQAHLKRGEQLNEGLRFVIGLQLNLARPYVALAARGSNKAEEGDGFEAWYKAKFGLEESTARNWMKFANTVLAVGQKSKSATVALLEKLPQQLTQGEFSFDMLKVTGAVLEVMGEDGMMDFIDKHAVKKPAGPIKFHCLHCGAENSAVHGKKLKCAECKKPITAVPDRKSDEQALKEDEQAARDYADDTMARHSHLMANTSTEAQEMGPRKRAEIVESCRALARFLTEEFKQKPGKTKGEK